MERLGGDKICAAFLLSFPPLPAHLQLPNTSTLHRNLYVLMTGGPVDARFLVSSGLAQELIGYCVVREPMWGHHAVLDVVATALLSLPCTPELDITARAMARTMLGPSGVGACLASYAAKPVVGCAAPSPGSIAFFKLLQRLAGCPVYRTAMQDLLCAGEVSELAGQLAAALRPPMGCDLSFIGVVLEVLCPVFAPLASRRAPATAVGTAPPKVQAFTDTLMSSLHESLLSRRGGNCSLAAGTAAPGTAFFGSLCAVW